MCLYFKIINNITILKYIKKINLHIHTTNIYDATDAINRVSNSHMTFFFLTQLFQHNFFETILVVMYTDKIEIID